MRIGIDIRSLIEKSPSGVTEYTTQLLTHLMRFDKENQYLLFYNNWHSISPKLLNLFKCSNVELKVFEWPNKIFNSSLFIFNYPKIDSLIGNVDLFFVPNINFMALSGKCRKIVTVHDLSFKRYPLFYSAKGRLWHKIINPQKIFNRADRLIAVSESTKNDLIELYHINQKKIKVVYSGVNQNFFEKVEPLILEKIKKKYNITKPYIFTLSNLEPRKNIETLILAFDKLRQKYKLDYQLVIGGSQAWTPNRKIYSLAKNSAYSADIKFLGYVEASDKSSLYQAAAIFVFPSFYEGFGFPPLEAMASGTPVVAAFSSSLPEITKEAALLFNPYNINELVEALDQILTDEKLKCNLIEKGYEQASHFSWDKTAWETLNLFNELVRH